MIKLNNKRKILIIVIFIILLLSSCDVKDDYYSVIRTVSIDGKEDTIYVSYHNKLSINSSFELIDDNHAVKSTFIRSFSQIKIQNK